MALTTDKPSWALGPFVRRDEVNPVLAPREESVFECPLSGRCRWEQRDVFNPAAVVHGGRLHLLYRAEDTIGRFKGVSRIGLAVSDDGVHFQRHPEPVLYPDNDGFTHLEWEGGCEDPRVVTADDGRFVMTYTGFNGTLARMCVATSKDLVHWTKHGPAMAGEYGQMWTKSGSIVCRREGDKLVAVKLGGKYWMYFGDTDIFAATSDDLMRWTPFEHNYRVDKRLYLQESGRYVAETKWAYRAVAHVMRPRRGSYDGGRVECGPPALLTQHGIVLMYAGVNPHSGDGNPKVPPGAYSTGQVLFDPADPTCIIGRATEPTLSPQRPLELMGQRAGTFATGLAFYRGECFLYYGTADSAVAVATAPAP